MFTMGLKDVAHYNEICKRPYYLCSYPLLFIFLSRKSKEVFTVWLEE